MNSKKSICKNKKGSYLVEAALALPLFILAFTALALVINIITQCEEIVFEECRIIHQIDMKAPQIIPNPRSKVYKVKAFSYLYSDGSTEDLIYLCAGKEFRTELPLGIGGKIDFKMKVLSRGFTGAEQHSDTLGEEDFQDGSESCKVVIFPKYGIRYHRLDCRYVKQEYEGEEVKIIMEKKDAELKGMTPCLICGG